MKIYKQYKDETFKTLTPLKKFIERTEGMGCYKKGTALQTLKRCGMVQTNWAWYTLTKD
jgi:hypothetical protein